MKNENYYQNIFPKSKNNYTKYMSRDKNEKWWPSSHVSVVEH